MRGTTTESNWRKIYKYIPQSKYHVSDLGEDIRGLLIYVTVAFTTAYLMDIPIILKLVGMKYLPLILAARMYAPFLAVIAVITLTRKPILRGLKELGIRLSMKNLKYFFLGAGIPYAIYALGTLYAYILGFRVVNPVAKLPLAKIFGPVNALIIALAGAYIAAITVNTALALGEEIGWRGYLYTLLRPRFGLTVSSIIIGTMWALWHAPLILYLGYNYPHHRDIVGLGMFVLICSVWSYIMLYLREVSGSVLPPATMHGAINALGGLMMFTVDVKDEVYSMPVGLLSILASLTLAILIATLPRTKMLPSLR